MMSLWVIVAMDGGLDFFLVLSELNYFKFVWHALHCIDWHMGFKVEEVWGMNIGDRA